MKAVVAAFNQEKALVGAFSVITDLRMELFEALLATLSSGCPPRMLLVTEPELPPLLRSPHASPQLRRPPALLARASGHSTHTGWARLLIAAPFVHIIGQVKIF